MKKSIIAHFSEGGGQLKRKNHSTSEFAENYLRRKEAKRQRRIAINNEELRKKLNDNSLASMHLSVYASKIAFTLAEVLITLGIIGVVAAMTLPTLIAKYQEKETVTALKKAYSTLSQAYLSAKNEYGVPSNWYPENSEHQVWSDTMLDNFAKYMKTTKICYSDEGCFPDVMYKKLDGGNTFKINSKHDDFFISKLITSDGMSIFFNSYGPNISNKNNNTGKLSETYAAVSVDINGFKKPNVFGKDIFTFIVLKDSIIPNGASRQKILNSDTQEHFDYFPGGCNTKDCYGYCEGCAAWVIQNENMDYLHCDDLSWNGKTTCK